MEAVRGHWICRDGCIVSAEDAGIQTLPLTGAVYEVLRVQQRVVLFGEEHFRRMEHSLELKGIALPRSVHAFSGDMDRLIEANAFAEGNIKLVVLPEDEGTLCYFIPHFYPSVNDYQDGVLTGLFHAERESPNAKVVLTSLRQRVADYLRQNNLFEVLYVNQSGQITEGSRTNVFFIRGDEIFTAPAGEVLGGITRQKVLECIHRAGLQVTEISVHMEDLPGFDAVFLTGTSIKVMPVRKVDNWSFDTHNDLLLSIHDQYNRLMERYIADQGKQSG